MENQETVTWKGIHISEFRTSLNAPLFPDVINKDDHTVLVQTPVIPDKVPDSFPSIYDKVDCWDGDHIKLPCSEKNVTEDQINRWNLIREALSSVILSRQQLEAAILSYNKRFAKRWNFTTLRVFFDEVCDEEESSAFFQSLLPKMIDLALCLPELITGGIPTLKHGRSRSITLSQMQIASLLANAFFITFPHRNSYAKGCEYANYPTINFTGLFQAVFRDRRKATHEKIKCILHYFRRVTATAPTGVVTYSRHFVPKLSIPDWAKSTKLLPKLYVSSTGTIEDEGFGLLQVDFAHKLVGGGVLSNGCVQEEIRFVICPELILSRLFTECLEDNEAFIVTGCERFSKYKGYGKSFEWDGNFVDATPSDEQARKHCTILAIDALYFKKNFVKEQYLPSKMNRELNKAYAGFSWDIRRKKEEICGVATGNWGCGVYRGNPEFKSLLQLMAASESNRDLAYFTFGNEELRDSMHAIHEYLVRNKITIGKIYDLLLQYNVDELCDRVSVYDFIKSEATSSNASKKVTPKPTNTTKITNFFGPSAVTKRSLCYSLAKKSDPQRDRSPFKETPPTVSNETEDMEIKKMKSKESELLMRMYQSAPLPSTSAADGSDESDDSFDLDKYRKIKRTKRYDDDSSRESREPQDQSSNESGGETQFHTPNESEPEAEPVHATPNESENESKHTVCDTDEETSKICSDVAQAGSEDEKMAEDRDISTNSPMPAENTCTSGSSRDVSDVSENFQSAQNSPKNVSKLLSRSVPLKGLKFIPKTARSKETSAKKKFPNQKSKISNYFLPSQN